LLISSIFVETNKNKEIMTTFEIINLTLKLTKLRSGELEQVLYTLPSGKRIDIRLENTCFGVYLDEYFEDEDIWESEYIDMFSLYHTDVAIANTIGCIEKCKSRK